MLVPPSTTGAVLNRLSGGGYHLQSSKHENTSLSALPICYSPLFPSCPGQSQFNTTFCSLK
jgi:hypothetical protein